MSTRRRRIVLPVVGAALVGVLAGSLLTGWLYPGVDSSAIDNASKELLVTAQVSEQPAREVYSLSGQVAEATTVDVLPLSVGDSASVRQVVSGRVRGVGEQVRVGEVLAEVSGQPVFAVLASVPLYRDLEKGASGNDVSGLQQMLTQTGLYTGSTDGKLGATTLNAITAMYTRSGYTIPTLGSGNKGLPLTHIALIPADGVTASDVAGVGEEISKESPLMTVETSPPVITARADMLQVDAFPVGTVVSVQVGATSGMESTVVAVSEFKAAENATPLGYDVTIVVPEGVDVAAALSQPVLITETAEVPLGLAVPLTAIRRDADGSTYVLLSTTENATPGVDSHVAVTVIGQVTGYAIIEENSDLPVGADVVISGG